MKKPKQKKALWTQAFPAQVKPSFPKRTACLVAYFKARAIFLGMKTKCDRCGHHGMPDVHHIAGRRGPLLADMKNFSALCRDCHRWVHDHPLAARPAGLLAQAGDWNK
jgi:hypothetical protein